YYALTSGTTSGATKYIPVSREMLASNRKAAFTTLALFRHAFPRAQLLTGRFFFLGGSTDLRRLEDGSLAGDLSGIVAKDAPALLRPYTFPPLELSLISDWEVKVRRLAEESARLPITAISGVPAWVLVLFDRLKKATGKKHIAEIWPELRLVVHGGTKWDPYRELFRKEVGSDEVKYVETYPCSEGFVATEDPRFGLLRLVPDHGIFFEFVPVEDLGAERPPRHTLREAEPGVQYAVAVTTCAGLWSYLVGDTVAFERRDPPLLRFTGRTKYYLSAFGEHLISEEVEKAVAEAARQTGRDVVDFHVGPVFPADPGEPGHHRYFVEFAQEQPPDLDAFAGHIDAALCRLNEDYEAHRRGDLSMRRPEVVAVPPGGFAEWMRSRGRYGGQNKVPRMDNTGEITRQIGEWLEERGRRA
ncbi:MAG TPA: GH3 auxin-responsive promoter family protein, partial [Gemmataceae bacterium]